MIICPGCGLELPSPDGAMDTLYRASWACRELSGEAAAYTLSLQDADFIQHLVIDAYAAQHAGPCVKPIGVAFALIGLLLTFERGYSGRRVQRAHMQLARKSKAWPHFEPPAEKAVITVRDVIQSTAGDERNAMIRTWGKSVWEIWQPEHDNVRALVERNLDAR